MTLFLSKAFGLVKAQDKSIAHEFCNKIGEIIKDPEYSEDIVIQTVDAILADIPKKDKSLRIAIEQELVQCYPDIEWSFKSNYTNPELAQCAC